jgi:hypothetical protein
MSYFKFENIATKKILNGVEVHPDETPLGDGHPYLKFAFEVKFITTGGEYGFDTTPVFLAKTCELPRWTADTQVVNVYNHKTLVQTKLTYEPITMTLYDQTNDSGDKMIWEWVQEQFDPTDGSKAAKFKSLEIEIKMKNLSAPGAPDKVYRLKNAYIVDAQHDTLDYSTSDPVLWSLTIRYEDLEAPGYQGPTPSAGAHIKPLPKPPAPVKPSEGKKTQSSSFTPITNPPKKDAVKAQEAPTSQSTYTDPMGTTDGAAIMSVAGTAPKKELSWPSWVPFLGKKTSNGNLTNSTEGTVKPVTATTTNAGTNANYNTNTGTDKVSTPAKPPVSQKTADFIASQEKSINQDAGLNPEYKKAYIEALKKYPPRTDSAQSQQSAEQRARLIALQSAPQYKSQARTVDNGVIIDKHVSNNREPYAAPARVGNTNANPNINDKKGEGIVSRQTTFENNVRSAQNVNDQNAAQKAYMAGKLTKAQEAEYFKTGKVTGIKGAPGYDPNEKSNF